MDKEPLDFGLNDDTWKATTEDAPTKQAEQEPVMITPGGGAFPFAVVGELEQAEQEPVWSVEECDRVVKTLRYIQGIAERGLGRSMREDETIEQFVLGYVKQLEATPVRTKNLTDDEIDAINFIGKTRLQYARAVIAKFKEKNK